MPKELVKFTMRKYMLLAMVKFTFFALQKTWKFLPFLEGKYCTKEDTKVCAICQYTNRIGFDIL